MRKCRECGFPRKFTRYFDWRSDGTIVSTDRSRTRSQVTFLESGELENLFGGLSNTIGIDVDRFLIQAHKNVGKELYANLPVRHIKKIPSNRLLRPQWLTKLMVRLIASDIAGLGDGRVSCDHYRAGRSLTLRFKNPCVTPMLVGGSVGIYESFESMPSSEYEYGLEGGDLVVWMSPSEKKPTSEVRLYLEEIEPGEGPLVYKRCGSCSAPLISARSLDWDMERGIISNRLTGEREVLVTVPSMNAILRELESELGDEVPRLLYERQKELTKKRLFSEDAHESGFWENLLMELALRGLGYPMDFKVEKGSILVEIGNAYNQDLYAAKLAAALEVVTSKPSRITWEVRESKRGAYEISIEAPSGQ